MGSYVGRLKAAQLSPDLRPCECELGALDKGSLSTGLQPLSAQPILCICLGPTANPDRERQVERARRLDIPKTLSSRRAEWTRILADIVRIVLEARFPIRI